MSKKYQIFISSTYEDLKAERDQVIKATLEMGHIPVGMEMFSAADEEQWNIIARQIDEVDYYCIILAHRYGSVAPSGTGYTEKEYEYAISKGIPVLGFVINDGASWPAAHVENDPQKRERLEQFRAKVKNRMVNFWENRNDLHAKFSIALMKAFLTHPRTGWSRASDVAGPEVIKELSRLSAENADLRKQIETMQRLEREHDLDTLSEVFNTLERNKVTAYVRFSAAEWGEPIKVNLLTIFSAIAPNMIIENYPEEMARDAALGISGKTGYYKSWPIPKNYIQSWIVDLHALEIITPSTKKHPVSDSNEYWTLTDLGKKLLSGLRKFHLKTKIEQEEQPSKPTATDQSGEESKS